MKSSIYTALLSASIAAAQVGIECSGYRFPNYQDCDRTIDYFGFRDMPEDQVVAENGENNLPEPSCTWWYWNDGNCRISTCWSVTNDYLGDIGRDYGPNVARGYDGIRGQCESFRAGGTWPSALDENGISRSYFEVFNDPDQSPPGRKRRSNRPGRFIKETVSLEQHQQWVNETLARSAKREAAIMNAKRADDDDGYEIINSAIGVRDADNYAVGPRLSNGVGYTYETSETTTFTTTVSVDIGGAFEIFSAGVGYEYSQSDSFTVTEGITFNVECAAGQQGQATFYPFFDYYDVNFLPSGTRTEIWLPVTSDRKINGEIEVQCLG